MEEGMETPVTTETKKTNPIQTRTETSRSLEDAEKYRAIETLKEVGLLIPVDQIDTFHGRVGRANENWAVDSTFSNAGNDTGNDNFNKRPTLYTSDRETASEFAKARRDNRLLNNPLAQGDVQIHEIQSFDTDASILDTTFNHKKLNEADRARYSQALNTLAIPITEGSPVDFSDRHATEPFLKEVFSTKKNLIYEEEVTTIAARTGTDIKVARQLASAYNARRLVTWYPELLAKNMARKSDDIYIEKMVDNGKEVDVPVNLEYVERFMRSAHIVGVKQYIRSATLGNKDITSFSFFDLEKVGTPDQIAAQREEFSQKLGGLTDKLPQLPPAESSREAKELIEILHDPHAKPQRLVEAAKKIEGYNEVFDADAGNWEGYTLGQHTETVLRNFDENFADILPVEYLGTIRLAILSHDIGKPLASSRGEKHRQKDYNRVVAKDFLGKIGIDPTSREFLTALITDGSELSFRNQLRPDEQNSRMMESFAEDVIRRYSGTNLADSSQVTAFIELCKILQLCDGGAYTSMSITRTDRGRHRNAPSFNKSFRKPIGLGKRNIAYK